MNFGASVDVGRIFWYASGPGNPSIVDLEEGEALYPCSAIFVSYDTILFVSTDSVLLFVFSNVNHVMSFLI